MPRVDVLEWMSTLGEVTVEGDPRGWKCVWDIWGLDEYIVDVGLTLAVAVQRVLKRAKTVMEEEDFHIHKKGVYDRLVAEINKEER